ncbi:MAG: PilZ domain-containing protein [Candidatus Omnitrophota bacterium]
MSIIEKRRHMRFETDVNGEFKSCGSSIQGLFVTNNFSRGGFRAIFNQQIEQNSLLECEMTFPQSIMPFFVTARVIWVKESDTHSGLGFEAGVQLQEFDAIERQYFVEACYENWSKTKDNKSPCEFTLDY